MELNIVYPNNLKPIDKNLSEDELVKRLKVLAVALRDMSQDENTRSKYIPLALYLAGSFFLNHPSNDVQLLIGCCIADFLRIFAPEAPYQDEDEIKTIIYFLIRQLNGLRDPKDASFKRYVYLLENLSCIKSFNMCFELDDFQDILCELFNLILRIVSDEHSSKVKMYMTEILIPLINETDSVSNELLDIMLCHIIEPQKTQKRNAYAMIRDVIYKTSDTIVKYIQTFLNDAIIADKPDKRYTSTLKLYDLIYEVNVINPNLLLSVLPQLECKLKSTHDHERLKAVSLLARMFSEKDSKLARQHTSLWNNFLGRFLDITVNIRIKCVQSTMHFLLNHPKLHPDIISILKSRQHDSDETVRFEVVTAIVETTKRDFKIVAESPDLMEVLKERSLDKKFKIRKAAMNGLANVYQKYLMARKDNDTVITPVIRSSVSSIQNKILNGYYKSTLDDQLLVERLLTTHLVPYQFPDEDRICALYRLLATADDNATKAFIELQKNQMKIRKNVADWVKMHRGVKEMTPDVQREMDKKCVNISKYFPEPIKSQEYLMKFSQHMLKDRNLLKDMDLILKRDVQCRECSEAMTAVLKKLGQPVMTNLYYNIIKMLLNRVASVMVDKNGIEILIHLIEKQLSYIENPKPKRPVDQDGTEFEDPNSEDDFDINVLDDLDLFSDDVAERGLRLLTILIYLFPAHFQHLDILNSIISLLSFGFSFVALNIFKAITHLGRFKPLIESHVEVLETIAPVCKMYIMSGEPKEAKHAIRCLFVNSQSQLLEDDEEVQMITTKKEIDGIFQNIVESLTTSLDPDQENYQTAIVSLGHIAYNMPDRFCVQLKNLVSRKIVKELLIKRVSEPQIDDPQGNWCEESGLRDEIKWRIEGLKTVARWLIGLKDNTLAAQKTFRMLHTFIKSGGDILNQGNLAPAEKSWLRLSAGKAMLKICEQKGVGDEFNAEQFFTLSTLMNDPVLEVRECFMKKLHKGLYKGIPHKCLPLDFMGFYVLSGRETDKRLMQVLKTNYEIDVNHRREYVKTFSSGGVEHALRQLPNILPDYILPFAVSVLAHNPWFSDPVNTDQLKRVEKCLWFILEPLIENKDMFCFSLYRILIEQMKHSKSAYQPNNDLINTKIWTICDLTMHILLSKLKTIDMREYKLDHIQIPVMYFLPQSGDFQNSENYLTQEYRNSGQGSAAVASTSGLKRELDAPKNNAKVVAKKARVV